MNPDEETASAIVYRDCEHDGFPCRECMVIRIAAALRTAVMTERSEGQIRLANAVARVGKRARQEEREACADIADSPEWDWHSSGVGDEQWPCLSAQSIASAIRARAQE